MSLINEALKRAQKAQVGHEPRQDRPLQAAIVPKVRGSRIPVLFGIAGLASLGVAFWLNPLARRHAHETPSSTVVSQRATGSPMASASMPTLSLKPESRSVVVAAAAGASPAPGASLASAQQETPPAPPQEAPILNAPPAPKVQPAGENPGSKVEPTAVRSPELNVYVVRAGDTLTRIARRHGTTVQALRATNDLKLDRINVGQKLKVPGPPPTRATAAVS